MSDFEELEYLPEAESEDAELTGNEPKFVRLGLLELFPAEIKDMAIEDQVRAYIELRNQLATDRHSWEARERKIKDQMQTISMLLRDRADAEGVDSYKTPSGTAFRRVSESFRVNDWRAVCDYVRQTDNFQIFQRRVSSTSVREIREQDGEIPPGLDPYVEVEFAVRSPVAGKSKTRRA
jgi:hypothetical protein